MSRALRVGRAQAASLIYNIWQFGRFGVVRHVDKDVGIACIVNAGIVLHVSLEAADDLQVLFLIFTLYIEQLVSDVFENALAKVSLGPLRTETHFSSYG